MTLKFTVVGKAATKGSTRAVSDKRGAVHVVPDNPRTVHWEREVAWAARLAGATPLAGPVRVELLFELHCPESRVVGRPCETRPDLDKLVRAVLDGLTHLCFEDDGQVTEIIAAKVYGRDPQVTISIEPAGGLLCH